MTDLSIVHILYHSKYNEAIESLLLNTVCCQNKHFDVATVEGKPC